MIVRPALHARARGTLVHEALFYRTVDDFVAGCADFLRIGLRHGDAALVSVPAVRHEPLREALGDLADEVRFADMTRVGVNPARIIPFVRGFADQHAGRRLSFVGEPIWAGRTPAEIRECVRHEALLNAAFADIDISILCPYDALGLGDGVIVDAWRTHPTVGEGPHWADSPYYLEPDVLYAAADRPMTPPPAGALVLRYFDADLPLIRQIIREQTPLFGLTGDRVDDLTVALNEIVTNTVRHTGTGGTLRIWVDAEQDAVVCEVTDAGRIADLLAGRRRPSLDAEGGRGLWLANQLCDLVELRSGERGSTIRLYTRRG
jgi:anti-sigma regulatory factor (Ser/Thr protein kinase)